MSNTKKSSSKVIAAAFVVFAITVVVQNVSRDNVTRLSVPDNKGTSFLETAGGSLVSIFQDGQTCVWDWADPHARQGEFKAASARAIVLSPDRMAAVTLAGKKILTVHSLPDGIKQQEMSVGFDDQDIWPRISFDKSVAALVRRSPPQSGQVLYEFMTVDLDKELLGLPSSLAVSQTTETMVDYAVDSGHILYAVGSRDKTGRIAAINLETGSILWDRVFEGTKEFCSVIDSPDGRYLLAGNRDGLLYKIKAATGEIEKTIVLLEPGETRPITNDYSVLNLAFSPDGQYYVATINPPAYILQSGTDKLLITKLHPADKLISKIAFSPDSRFLATSDIRVGYSIKIWPLAEEH